MNGRKLRRGDTKTQALQSLKLLQRPVDSATNGYHQQYRNYDAGQEGDQSNATQNPENQRNGNAQQHRFCLDPKGLQHIKIRENSSSGLYLIAPSHRRLPEIACDRPARLSNRDRSQPIAVKQLPPSLISSGIQQTPTRLAKCIKTLQSIRNVG
jgi:hypothetical protein